MLHPFLAGSNLDSKAREATSRRDFILATYFHFRSSYSLVKTPARDSQRRCTLRRSREPGRGRLGRGLPRVSIDDGTEGKFALPVLIESALTDQRSELAIVYGLTALFSIRPDRFD